MNFFRNALFQLGTSIAGIPLGIVTSVVLARYLSVADRGNFALLTTFAAVIVLFSQIGWPSASIYRLRRAGSEPARVSGAALFAVAGSSLLAIGACLVFRSQLTERFFHGVPAGLYYVVLAMVPFQLLGLSFSGIARGIDRFALQNAYRLLLNVGNFTSAVLVLVLWGKALHDIMIAVLVVQIAAAIWLTATTLRQTKLSARVDVTEMVEGLRFGLKSYVTSLTGQLHERIDLFMLALLLAAPEEIAYYAVAVGVLQRIQVVPEAIGTALFPKLAGLEEAEAGTFASYVSRHSTAWVILAVVILGTTGPFLIPLLYGEQYTRSVAPFLILLPGVAAITIYRVLGRYFLALGRQAVNIWTQLASTTTNILLNAWLIPLHGVLGAAIASLISYSLEAFLITVVFLKVSKKGILETFVFKAADLGPYRERVRRFRRRLSARRRRPSDPGSDS